MGGQEDATLPQVQERLYSLLRRLDRHFQLKAKYDEVVRMAREHPHAAVVVGAVALVSAVPIACFLGFVFFSAFFALLGFVFIEGFLVTIGVMILLGIVFVLASVTVVVTGSAVMAWMFAKNGQSLLNCAYTKLQAMSRTAAAGAEKPVDKED